MGAAAAGLADVAVVTSDNPRSEDPDAIIEAVVAGVLAIESKLIVEPDRAAAISAALAAARPGDVVLIAGKGHEPGQEIAGQIRALRRCRRWPGRRCRAILATGAGPRPGGR